MNSSIWTKDRPVRDVPLVVSFLLVLTLLLQITWHSQQAPIVASAKDLPSPLSARTYTMSSLGEPIATAKVLNLWLQAFDNQPGVSIPFNQLSTSSFVSPSCRVHGVRSRRIHLAARGGGCPLRHANGSIEQAEDHDRLELLDPAHKPAGYPAHAHAQPSITRRGNCPRRMWCSSRIVNTGRGRPTAMPDLSGTDSLYLRLSCLPKASLAADSPRRAVYRIYRICRSRNSFRLSSCVCCPSDDSRPSAHDVPSAHNRSDIASIPAAPPCGALCLCTPIESALTDVSSFSEGENCHEHPKAALV